MKQTDKSQIEKRQVFPPCVFKMDSHGTDAIPFSIGVLSHSRRFPFVCEMDPSYLSKGKETY